MSVVFGLTLTTFFSERIKLTCQLLSGLCKLSILPNARYLDVSNDAQKKSGYWIYTIWSDLGIISMVSWSYMYGSTYVKFYSSISSAKNFHNLPFMSIFLDWRCYVFPGDNSIDCMILCRNFPFWSIGSTCAVVAVISLTYGIFMPSLFRLIYRSTLSL